MIYLQSLSEQTEIFLQALGFGFILGILYDLFRIVRLVLSSGKRFIFAQDVLYVLVCAVLSFLFFLTVDNGKVRGYAFFGELLGWLVYYFSLGTVVLRFSEIIIRFFKRLFSLIFAPFRFVIGIIMRLCVKISSATKKILKKIHKKSKFYLKLHRMLVYNHKCISATRKKYRD